MLDQRSADIEHLFGGSHRASFWARALSVARLTDEWVLVPRRYTRGSASQIVSDIINSDHRDLSRLRVRGVRPGEQWDARWQPLGTDPGGDCEIWLRLMHPDEPSQHLQHSHT